MARTIKAKVGDYTAIGELGKSVSEKISKTIAEKAVSFTKTQLVNSRKYIHRRDALNALLKNDEQYSFAQVDEILNDFDKGVKE